MKKLAMVGIVAMLVAVNAVPAFAHGHHGGQKAARYAVCPVQNCVLTGVHAHNGKNYSGHHYADGHGYHYNGYHAGRGHY